MQNFLQKLTELNSRTDHSFVKAASIKSVTCMIGM